ncbi:MAG: hypothetical protein CMM01_13980 [Rhodopirellula sp.]|nr:hypothetical protein [Rhodopirellula sp.]
MFLALSCFVLFECKAEELALFGLDDVEVISDSEGTKVRGLGMFARSNVAAGISVNIMAPGFGSNFNLFATDHNHTNDGKLTSDVTAQPTGLGVAAQSVGIAKITSFNLLLNSDSNGFIRAFDFEMSALTSQSSGQTLGGAGASLLFQQ